MHSLKKKFPQIKCLANKIGSQTLIQKKMPIVTKRRNLMHKTNTPIPISTLRHRKEESNTGINKTQD